VVLASRLTVVEPLGSPAFHTDPRHIQYSHALTGLAALSVFAQPWGHETAMLGNPQTGSSCPDAYVRCTAVPASMRPCNYSRARGPAPEGFSCELYVNVLLHAL
jgi:hypothetical protein